MGRAERSAARAAARAAEPAGTPGAPDEETEIPELKDEENPAEDRLSAIPEENSTTASEKPAAALTLVEQVARIKEQLGIEAATLPDAVQQANTVMGLAGGGALPAQVEALVAALGLAQPSEPTQPAAAAPAPAATRPAKAASSSPSKSPRGAAGKKRFSLTPLKTKDAGDKEAGDKEAGDKEGEDAAVEGSKSGQGGRGGAAPPSGKRGSLFGRFKGKAAAKPEPRGKAAAAAEGTAEAGAEESAAQGAGGGEARGGERGAGQGAGAAAVVTTLSAEVHAVRARARVRIRVRVRVR